MARPTGPLPDPALKRLATMDAIPTDTHAAELAATIDDLEGGLAPMSLSRAVNRIDDWRREILVTERADLQSIADDLGRLHESLTGEGINGAVIGPILVSLGEQTEATADSADERLRNSLKRLGSLLSHAGHALGGNAST